MSPAVPPEEALQILSAGNQRYLANQSIFCDIDHPANRKHQSKHGQFPIAAALISSDSRFPAETVFDVSPHGDLFLCRNAGNLATPETVASLEYAATQLSIQLILVCGNSSCDFIARTLDMVKGVKRYRNPFLRVVDQIEPAAAQAVQQIPDAPELEQHALAVELNVWYQMERLLLDSMDLKDLCQRSKLQIHGAVYNIQTGVVEFLGEHPQLKQLLT